MPYHGLPAKSFLLKIVFCCKPYQEKKKPACQNTTFLLKVQFSALFTGGDFLSTDLTFLCWTGHQPCST